jgi:hypothetical protein
MVNMAIWAMTAAFTGNQKVLPARRTGFSFESEDSPTPYLIVIGNAVNVIRNSYPALPIRVVDTAGKFSFNSCRGESFPPFWRKFFPFTITRAMPSLNVKLNHQMPDSRVIASDFSGYLSRWFAEFFVFVLEKFFGYATFVSFKVNNVGLTKLNLEAFHFLINRRWIAVKMFGNLVNSHLLNIIQTLKFFLVNFSNRHNQFPPYIGYVSNINIKKYLSIGESENGFNSVEAPIFG